MDMLTYYGPILSRSLNKNGDFGLIGLNFSVMAALFFIQIVRGTFAQLIKGVVHCVRTAGHICTQFLKPETCIGCHRIPF